MRIYLMNSVKTSAIEREKVMNVMNLLANLRNADKVSLILEEVNIESECSTVFSVCSIYSPLEKFFIRKLRIDQFLRRDFIGSDSDEGYIVTCWHQSDIGEIASHIGGVSKPIQVLALLDDPIQKIETTPTTDNVVITHKDTNESRKLRKAKCVLIAATLMAITGIGLLIAGLFWR